MAIWHVIDFVDENSALLGQFVHYIAVMHNFAADIDGSAEGFEGDFDNVNRTHHAGAKATRLEQQNPFLAGGSIGLATVQGGVEDSCGHSNSIPMCSHFRAIQLRSDAGAGALQ